jgi:hypothetical protein
VYKKKKKIKKLNIKVFKLRAQFQDGQDQAEALHRENKALADEVRELVEQLSSGGRSAHELEKSVRRAEAEKSELQVGFLFFVLLF